MKRQSAATAITSNGIFAEWLDLPLGELGTDPARVADKHDEITKEHRPYMANFPNYRNISRSFRVRCQALDEPRNPWRECRLHYPTRASLESSAQPNSKQSVLRYLLLWKRRSPNIGLCEIGSAEHRAARNSGISDEAGRSRRAKGLGSANCLTRNSKLLPTARIGAHRGRVRGALPPLPTPTKPTISHSIVRMRQFISPALRDTLSGLPIDD